jgi:hypothetical protein
MLAVVQIVPAALFLSMGRYSRGATDRAKPRNAVAASS